MLQLQVLDVRYLSKWQIKNLIRMYVWYLLKENNSGWRDSWDSGKAYGRKLVWDLVNVHVREIVTETLIKLFEYLDRTFSNEIFYCCEDITCRRDRNFTGRTMHLELRTSAIYKLLRYVSRVAFARFGNPRWGDTRLTENTRGQNHFYEYTLFELLIQQKTSYRCVGNEMATKCNIVRYILEK